MGRDNSPAIRKFNPGLIQPDEEVMSQFVVRHGEFEIVREVLRKNAESSSCQHVLVVAAPGMGKTMLMVRIAAELRTNEMLSERLIPIRFMEKSQEIFNIADFWLDALYYLARDGSVIEFGLERELKREHAALASRWREPDLAVRARAAVLEATQRLGKNLVLMVENLQAICDAVDNDFGWQLRETLQSEPRITLVATATSRSEGLDHEEQPFFDLFRTVELEPLGTEDCRALWKVVSRGSIRERQIRLLEVLTGGNPRLLVVVAEFARHRSILELTGEDLVKLIDEHTEHFRNHLDALPKTERRIYLATIDLWHPSRAGEIAARARMDIGVTSTMLGRLVQRGWLRVKGRGRAREYSATAWLYSIYYRLQRECDKAAVVHDLIPFMATAVYGQAERASLVSNSGSGEGGLRAIPDGMRRDLVEAQRLHGSDSRESDAGREDEATKVIRRIRTEIGNYGFAEAFEIGRTALQSLKSDLDQARILCAMAEALGADGNYEDAIATFDEVVERFGENDSPDVRREVARALLFKGYEQLNHGDGPAIATFDEVVERFGENDLPDVLWEVAHALLFKGESQYRLGQDRAAIATFDEVVERLGENDSPGMQRVVATALGSKGDAQYRLGRHEEAIATYREVLKRFGENDLPDMQRVVTTALGSKGDAQYRLGHHEEAIATYREVLERFDENDSPDMQRVVATALASKGDAQYRLGRHEEAIATCAAAKTQFGKTESPTIQLWIAASLVTKGAAYYQLGDHVAATIACREGDKICSAVIRNHGYLTDYKGNEFRWSAAWVRIRARLVERKRSAAMDAFQDMYDAVVSGWRGNVFGIEVMLIEILLQVIDMVALGAPELEMKNILSKDEKMRDTMEPLIVALGLRMGEAIRAPAEVIEVAADIDKRIEAAKPKNTGR